MHLDPRSRRNLPLVLAVAAAATAAVAQSPCPRFDAESFAAGTEPIGFALADVDGDGDLDAVVADGANRNVRVLWNDGAGRYPTSSTISLGAALGVELRGIAAGDLDLDGDLDVVVAAANGASQYVQVLKDQGSTLVLTGSVAGFPGYSGVALADLDGDGDLDAAGTTSAWRNDGTGGFTLAANFAALGGQSADEVVAGDFDGDGDVDVSTIRSGSTTPLQTFTNQGAWVFVHAPDIVSLSCCAQGLAAGDVDQDGHVDRLYMTLSDGVVVKRANSTETYPTLTGLRGLALGDVDGDGDLDVVVAQIVDSLRGTLRILVNQGGLLTASSSLPAGDDFGVRITVADVNGDLVRDVVSTERMLGTLSPRIASAPGVFPALDALSPISVTNELAVGDVDGDGLADVVGSTVGIGTWKNLGNGSFLGIGTTTNGSGPVLLADMNGDGRPDFLRADALTNTLRIVYNDGTGPRGPEFGQDDLVPAHDLAVGDVDLDGDLDVVVGAASAASVTLLRNTNGLGQLAASSIAIAGNGPKSVELADLDGDHDLDLVVASHGGSLVYQLANDGAGNFAAPQVIAAFAGAHPRALAAADLDRDGDVDLALGSEQPNRLDTLQNDGTGAFTVGSSRAMDRPTVRIVPAFLGNDGVRELCVVEATTDFGTPQAGRLSLWAAQTDGTLVFESYHVNGRSTQGLAVGDLDGDGRNDLCLPGSAVTRIQSRSSSCATGSTSCVGDGADGPCPCGNAGASGHGCANSLFASGALLVGDGVASVAHDTFVLHASNVSGAQCLFFQGQDLEPALFTDDGLQCLGTILRIGNRPVAANTSSYPQAGNAPISVRGQLPAVGGTRHYQAFYRNAAAFCTSGTSNRTNGVTLVWAP